MRTEISLIRVVGTVTGIWSAATAARAEVEAAEAVLEVEDQARLAAPASGRKKIDLSRESEISFGIGAKSECNRSG